MKKIILFLCLSLALGAQSMAQSDALYTLKDSVNADFNITYFQHIYGSYIRFIGSLAQDQDINIEPETFRNIRKVVVFNISDDDQRFNKNLIPDYRSNLEAEGITSMMEVFSDGMAIELFSKEDDGMVSNFVVMTMQESDRKELKEEAEDKDEADLTDADYDFSKSQTFYALDVECNLELSTLIKAFNTTDKNSLLNNIDKLDVLNLGNFTLD